MVLHPSDQHLVTGAEPLSAETRRDQVDGLGCSAREYDLVGARGVDVFAYSFARTLVSRGRPLAELMDAAVNVGVVTALLRGDRVDDRLEHL
jgi:hypothetical protein